MINSSTPSQFRRRLVGAAPLLVAMTMLGGCFGDGDNPPDPVATTTPAPMASASPATFNVTRCLNQMIPGTGLTVAGAVIPDTLKINLAAPSGFPNGRRLPDPVIDATLAVIFLDLTRHAPDTLARLPLNPPANDRAFRTTFPYLATPNGSPPLSLTNGTTFDFRTDSESAFVRVDRMGMPAVSTALIGTDRKNAYNDADPAVDATGAFGGDLTTNLTGLTNALADDLTRAGLTPCATPG